MEDYVRLVFVRAWLWALLLTGTSAGEPVAGWRGDGSGVFPNADPPVRWSDTLNVRWRTPLPNWGNSSPVVAGGRVFVTSEIREAFPELVCLDAGDGRELWRATLDHLPPDNPVRQEWVKLNVTMRDLLELRGEYLYVHETRPENAAERLAAIEARARARQATWRQKKVNVRERAYFGVDSPALKYNKTVRERLAKHCLWFATWGITCRENRGRPYGYADSFQYHEFYGGNSGPTWVGHAHPTPLVVGDTVYAVTAFNAVFALDVKTGKRRWVRAFPRPIADAKKKRLMTGPGMAFCYSPRWVDGRVVVLAGLFLRALDPRTGATIWERHVGRWSQHQRNDMGIVRIKGREFIGLANGRFYDAAEGREVLAGLDVIGKDQGLFLVHDDLVINNYRVARLELAGDTLKARTLHFWGGRDPAGQRRPKVNFRPRGSNKSCEYVCVADKLYAPATWELTSGKKVRDSRVGFGGAPLALAAGRIYVLNWQDRWNRRQRKLELAGGTVTVVEARTMKTLAVNKLSPAKVDAAKLKQLWRNGEVKRWRHFGAAAPFIAGKRIYIRSYDELICVGAE